jgi:hypothetical protein
MQITLLAISGSSRQNCRAGMSYFFSQPLPLENLVRPA